MTPRAAILAAIFIFLFLPYAILLRHSGSGQFSFDAFALQVFAFTGLQAALSAIASLVFGTVGAFGLLAYSRKSWLRPLVLLPNAVPTLMVILAAMNLYPATRGLAGIVWVHSLLNVGLVGIVIAGLFATRLGGMAELAYIEGAGRITFLFRCALPLLRGDLARLFLFVFAICFASFAVPLVIGGSRATTVEVLIYENVRTTLNWSGALGLAAIQMVLLIALSSLIRVEQASRVQATLRPTALLSWKPAVVVALIPTAIVLFGLLMRLPEGLSQWNAMQGFVDDLGGLIAGSFLVAIGTGLLTAFALALIAMARPEGWSRQLMLGFVAPSTAITGFALLLLWGATGWASLIKIALGLTMIAVPSFYRLYWDGWLQALKGQVSVAKTLGASDWLIFHRVLFPQLASPLMFLSGLAAFWAWGDFALSAVVGEKSLTVAMLAYGLMGSYRLSAATVVVCGILLGGTLTFMAFWGAGRVLGSRTQI